jgi:hypothetical protein
VVKTEKRVATVSETRSDKWVTSIRTKELGTLATAFV